MGLRTKHAKWRCSSGWKVGNEQHRNPQKYGDCFFPVENWNMEFTVCTNIEIMLIWRCFRHIKITTYHAYLRANRARIINYRQTSLQYWKEVGLRRENCGCFFYWRIMPAMNAAIAHTHGARAVSSTDEPETRGPVGNTKWQRPWSIPTVCDKLQITGEESSFRMHDNNFHKK